MELTDLYSTHIMNIKFNNGMDRGDGMGIIGHSRVGEYNMGCIKWARVSD